MLLWRWCLCSSCQTDPNTAAGRSCQVEARKHVVSNRPNGVFLSVENHIWQDDGLAGWKNRKGCSPQSFSLIGVHLFSLTPQIVTQETPFLLKSFKSNQTAPCVSAFMWLSLLLMLEPVRERRDWDGRKLTDWHTPEHRRGSACLSTRFWTSSSACHICLLLIQVLDGTSPSIPR